MIGIRFDFEENDIVVGASNSFERTNIDSQNCALISLCQICKLTEPETGAQIASLLQNRKEVNVKSVLANAKRQVERDGGTNVEVNIVDGDLFFKAEYNG